MEEVLAILNDRSSIGYLATVDNGKPRVRPWGFMFEENGRLYFCTSSSKDVYKQLMASPFIEFSATNKDMVWVRASGKIQFDENMKQKEKCFEVAPMLRNLYQSPENPVFKVFYLEHGQAVIADFSPKPPRVFEF
jgi:uncharacterized pyridoxamine 5'-phosphate oxidase family protein